MKLVIRNAAALLALALAALTLAAPAQARAADHRHGQHAWGQRLHAARSFRPARRHIARHIARHAFRRAAHVRHASTGNASWYGPGLSGHRTASGERFNAGALTAAHKSLPFGTIVRVTNRVNGRSVTVRINDRGPFVAGRSIDLSAGAARAIGMGGTSYVSLSVVR